MSEIPGSPLDYGPVLLRMPFGFHLTVGHPALRRTAYGGSRSTLAVSGFRRRARLGFSMPYIFSGQRRIIAAFGYGAPHPSTGGTSTPPDQRAAQRKIHASRFHGDGGDTHLP
jgi:hypothetical protein